jgi:hypothetical protein
MKTLILGGNNTSLGGILASGLDDCAALSRRTHPSVDITDPLSVEAIIRDQQPESIIFAAMTQVEPRCLGVVEDWEELNRFLDTKIKGGYITLNAAVKYEVKRLIMLAGSAVSSDPRLSHFTVVNGALQGMVQFADQHTSLEVYYVEMGIVLPSRAGEAYLESLSPEQREMACASAIPPQDVLTGVQDILAGKYPKGTRVILNKGNV